jgi:hypothetical protein
MTPPLSSEDISTPRICHPGTSPFSLVMTPVDFACFVHLFRYVGGVSYVSQVCRTVLIISNRVQSCRHILESYHSLLYWWFPSSRPGTTSGSSFVTSLQRFVFYGILSDNS